MIAVNLDQDRWNQVLACLAEIPWKIATPLIMAIGEQLRPQAEAGTGARRPNGPLEASEGPETEEGRQRPS